jgi:hypothetical protein
MKKFQFSKDLKKDLKANAKDFDQLLYKACIEAKEAGVKASVFAETLRATGFRCGTGPARSAYKAVREGGTLKEMTMAIMAVKAKRKEATTSTGTTGTKPDTLVGALQAALTAAKAGHLAVTETWLGKAQAILDAAKITTAAAVERMGGVAEPKTAKKTKKALKSA